MFGTSDPTVYRDPNRSNIERWVCTIIVTQRTLVIYAIWISVNGYLFIFRVVHREFRLLALKIQQIFVVRKIIYDILVSKKISIKYWKIVQWKNCHDCGLKRMIIFHVIYNKIFITKFLLHTHFM